MKDSLDHLRTWVGRTQVATDIAAAWPAAAMAATLDRDDPGPKAGDALPPGWHWLYFLETARASELGPDGHPRRGGFLPPVTLPRRMWAGGRIEFKKPLRVGDAIERRSEILSVDAKSGKSGNLVFVTVRHTVSAGGAAAVVEEHDIVYREAAKAGDPPPKGKPAPAGAQWRRELVPDEALLFRFSALIFNAHRIHYDLEYCRSEEHYPGLIVHGPLQTILLLDLARREAPDRTVKKLDYRALHPAFHREKLTVNGKPGADGTVELWTANAAGICTMSGVATLG